MRTIRRNVKYFLSVLAILTAAACTKTVVEESYPHEIAVNAIKETNTKASSASTPSLKTMGIFANCSSVPAKTQSQKAWEHSDFWLSNGDEATLTINNGCFAKSGKFFLGADPTNIKNKIPYYWPFSGSLMFAAYSPHDSQSEGIITKTNYKNFAEAKSQGYMEIDVKLKNEQNNFDLLFSDVQNTKTHASQEKAVPLRFKHAQAKITFKIQKPTNYRITTILHNCINSAIFRSGTSPGWLPNFSDTKKYFDYVISDGTEDGSLINKEFIIIPITLNGDYGDYGKTDPVNLEIHVEEDKTTDGIGQQDFLINMTQYTDTWHVNKHYIYSIVISPKGIVFDEPIVVDRKIEQTI